MNTPSREQALQDVVHNALFSDTLSYVLNKYQRKIEDIKVTPRIGGVGLMTRAMLLYNVCVAKYGEEKMGEVIG